MKPPLRFLFCFAIAFIAARAAEDPAIAAVRAADDERVAAMVAADPARLGAILSDDLRYAHSTAHVDSKPSLTEAIASGHSKYLSVTYEERAFARIAPDIVLMTGRGHFKVLGGGQRLDLFLSFLGVWRSEQGHWRFLAWQSCSIPEPARP